jgi:homospermidine synthase
MHIKAKRPVLVPFEYVAVLDTYSKAALMDLAYDLACVASGAADDQAAVWAKLNEHLAVVQEHRAVHAKSQRTMWRENAK